MLKLGARGERCGSGFGTFGNDRCICRKAHFVEISVAAARLLHGLVGDPFNSGATSL
jgi:hypothetical protein